MMDHFVKLQATWHKYFPKIVSFFKLFKNLALLWHHPFAFLFLLSLFTSPMQPIIRFFSPLIACTLLCMVAYISFEFLKDKTKENKTHMQIGECLDVLRLGEDWASNHVFQPQGWFKQEGDSTLFLEKQKITACIPAKDETFDVDQLGKNEDSHLDSSPRTQIDVSSLKDSKIHAENGDDFAQVDGLERQKGWDFDKTCDEFQLDISLKQEGSSLRSLAEPVVQRESKIYGEFENDMAGMDGQKEDEDQPSQSFDGLRPNTDSEQEDDDFSFFTEEMQKSQNYIQGEHFTIGLDKQVQDKECNFESYDSNHEHINLKPKDSFSFVEGKSEETKVEANLGETFIMDMADNLYQEHQNDSNPKHEDNLKQEIETQAQKEITNGKDILDHDQNLAAELHFEFQSDSKLKQEDEPKQESDSLVQIQGMNNYIDVLDHGHNKTVKLYDNSQSDSKPEIVREVEIQDNYSGMDVLDQEEDLKQDSSLASQKWTNWVRGVGADGLFFWTSEKDSQNVVVDPKRISTSFDEEIRGITTMDDDCVFNGAFTDADDSEDVPLEELSAFIQQLTVKLQSFLEVEAQAGQTRAKSEFANKTNMNATCNTKDVTESKFYNCNTQVQIHDDSNTEEGDGSSRWDGALDTSEKESADSENEDSEGRIWPLPLASDISDIGAAITEQVIDSLKKEYNSLEKEYKSLQDEISFRYGEEKAGNGELNEDSDESLDPYVTLFAECASDVEEHHHAEDQCLTFSPETSSIIEKNSMATSSRDRPSLDIKSVVKKSRLNRIGRAIRAIGKKRL